MSSKKETKKEPKKMNLKDALKKHHGDESVMSFGDGAIKSVQPICSSGLRGLDKKIGIGGYPKERIIEVSGPESGGKTTLCIHAGIGVQKVGGEVLYIDGENSLDIYYAENLGLNVNDNFLLSQPTYGEQGLDIIINALKYQKENPEKPLIIIVDSVDTLQPKKVIDDTFEEEFIIDAKGKKIKKKGGGMGLHAKLMSKACRTINANIKGSNTTVIFINQIRMKIGVMFGSPETTTGGNALKFYASVRLDIRNIGQHKVADVPIGNEFRIRVKKNKVAPPFGEYEGLNLWGKGFQNVWDLYNTCLESEVLIKNASWVTIKDTDYKFQGYNGFVELLDNEPDLETYLDSVLESE